MNENINLCEILKGLKGIELYSPIFGKVILSYIFTDKIEITTTTDTIYCFNSKGQFNGDFYPESECLIFPSKDQHDWSKFIKYIKEGTPMMCRLREGDWVLRYYAGIINGQHRVYRRDMTIADGFQKGMIPFDKFNPRNIEESLKYNIQK